MRSFNGVGGDFADDEFCDSIVTEKGEGIAQEPRSWWPAFREGKRFYVPYVAQLHGRVTQFNITKLTNDANKLKEDFGTHYPNCSDFGRKSFDKIVAHNAMSFGKAVMATRTINADLAHKHVQDSSGKVVEIGRGQIVMSGYRIEGLKTALGRHAQKIVGKTESESGIELLTRDSQVAQFIIDALSTDDGKFVVYPTARAIIQSLLRNRDAFGIPGEAVETTFLRLGPEPADRYSHLDLKRSIEETPDPKFAERVKTSPHPENPFKRTA